MPTLPNRPGPYVLILLFVILGVLTWWMQKVLTDPAIQQAVRESKAEREKRTPQPVVPLPPPATPASVPQNQPVDPVINSLHQEMIQPKTVPEREMEILQELINLNQRARPGEALGDNGDITLALVGKAPQGIWLPRQSPRIRDGQLLDRWGTAYWFHPNSSNQIEIRSAGPDKNLFTSDDLILNGSPAGFGATPSDAAP
ncbi:hypothetical protein [Prosthecobacter dejongeii]|uniref:Uncharacterized protein n=1 Tax=Prosthecobacter dejongeii TaxID=48465 RepID=A0A7W7YGV1_9BACT|nr:hypothetical protein [Prosthecobacter dejongeii]MBB5035902.1 hypothetical protein [Prosthecobacter dejongeii]